MIHDVYKRVTRVALQVVYGTTCGFANSDHIKYVRCIEPLCRFYYSDHMTLSGVGSHSVCLVIAIT